MESTAEDKGAPGLDPAYGWGIVDAYAALQFGQDPMSPVADAGSDQTLNDADNDKEEAVALDASVSYDPDGDIDTYEWKEGDTVLGTGEMIIHDFTVGTHTVTLTVTDNDNLSNTDEVIITVVTVTEEPTNLMHISDISMDSGIKNAAKNTFIWAMATVTVVDSNGTTVPNAVVSGTWSDLTSDSDIGTTDEFGKVTVQSDNIKSLDGTFTFTITDVVLTDWEYDTTAQNSGSITVPV